MIGAPNSPVRSGALSRSAVRRFLTALVALGLLTVACTATAEVAAEREIETPEPRPAAEQDDTVDDTAGATAAPVATITPAPPIPTPTETAPVAPAPTATATPQPEPTATPTPVPTPQPVGPCDAGPLATPNPNRPIYSATLAIDPPTRTVLGSMSIEFTPDLAVDEIYLRLWPNGPRPSAGGVSATLSNLTIDGSPVEPVIDDRTIVQASLDATVAAGETIMIAADFEVVVPLELNSRLSGRGDYMRLGTVMPILPWEPGRGWALDPATSLFAESVSSPVADYRVQVTVPDDYGVLASGVVDGDGIWQVEAARDFALSVGRFRTVTDVAMAPEPVQVTVGVHETVDDDASVYLAKIVDSLEQFSSRWGQYPWPSLTFAVTPNLSGGIEFPTHIMQGPNTTGRVTSHEVGHMFFYSLVGNNQGTEPWLDEGITSYAEFTYEGTPANAFPIPAAGVGNATQPMTYWEARAGLYYRSVYAQTGFALQRLGAQEDVDCALARYVAANAHQIATAADFIAAFEPTFPDIVEQMAALGVVVDE